jgi:hypothetical protein
MSPTTAGLSDNAPFSTAAGPEGRRRQYRGSVEDKARARAIDQALLPMVASLAPWGVVDAHWLAGPDGTPAVWLRTRTEIERVALEAQPWVEAQVRIILTRLSVDYADVARTRIHVTSAERQGDLFDGLTR